MTQIAPVLRREPVQIEKRRKLTRAELIHLMLEQDGKCGCGCGLKLNAYDPNEGVIDEHIVPLNSGGTNALTNRALYRKPCAKAKTKLDEANDAKANRLIRKADPEQRKPPQIQSRGFNTNLTKGLDGQVRPRRASAAKQSRGQ